MPRYYIKDNIIIKGIADSAIGLEPEPLEFDSFEDVAVPLEGNVKLDGGNVVEDLAPEVGERPSVGIPDVTEV